jgi:hypothetical protein
MGLSPCVYKYLTYGVGGILIGRGKEGCSILPYFFSIGNPLVRQMLKFDFHQAVFELLLLVLYKFNFQRLSGTTLFISMDYSYNPTSEPLLFGMTYVMGFTSNHKWAVFNTIILNDDNNP